VCLRAFFAGDSGKPAARTFRYAASAVEHARRYLMEPSGSHQSLEEHEA
jgi:hypothetical protein